MGTRIWLRAVEVSLAATERLRRATRVGERAVAGLALAALDDDELRRLTAARYAAARPRDRSELFDWERAWLERDLPAPPARILLGGAGAGRERRELERRGYDVVAFDPVPGDPSTVRLDYEGLAGPRLGDEAARTRVLEGAPYDAVLLGWGSFTHVPGAASRLAVLQALRALTDGPVLLSFWRREDDEERVGRATALGAGLARLLGATGAPRPGDRIAAHIGYAHAFSREELDALAADAGYEATWHVGAYGHATLRPTEP